MLAFVHIAKTAGTTITQVLRQSLGARHCDIRLWPHVRYSQLVVTADDIRRLSLIYWRLESIAGHKVVPYSDLHYAYPHLRFYTFCREPLARMASYYQMLVQKGTVADDFFSWIRTGECWNWQTQILAGYQDADAAIEKLQHNVGFVGLTERFNESLVMYRRWAGQPEIDIRYTSRNVAADNCIKQRLLTDPASRAALADANREDLKLYDYIVRKYFPRQQKVYGPTLAADVAQFEQNNKPRVTTISMCGKLMRDFVYKPLMPLTTRGRIPAHPARNQRQAA
ncbi:MAG: hypothetical protein OES79_13520 [Planctomycetota bacterium]|nr:hypothetical protein [Planctomycetota bacterium]